MKEITVKDCIELKEKFDKYCETAEQHEFPVLGMIMIKLYPTIEHITITGKVIPQHEARAMFRTVLKAIGQDFTEYIDDSYIAKITPDFMRNK